jgi:hypothetical protein
MMSAFHPKATEQRTQFYVGFVPIADINGMVFSQLKKPAVVVVGVAVHSDIILGGGSAERF